MIDLIGRPYRYGADGTDPDGALDCIHLVYVVLERLGTKTPPFDPDWYIASGVGIARDLLRWTDRISEPAYDGDIALLAGEEPIFAVTWQNGLLYINRQLERVAWCPIGVTPTCHCFRMRSN